LTAYQTDETKNIVTSIDTSSFGNKPIEHVILATITLVVDRDVTPDPDQWDPSDRIVHRPVFQDLCDAVLLEQTDIWHIRERIRSESEQF
jgi:hypothetical protein